jgi:hypothetical protein
LTITIRVDSLVRFIIREKGFVPRLDYEGCVEVLEGVEDRTLGDL